MATTSDNKVFIFDTTLRDGEQSPGISLNEVEKVEIAEQLSKLKVDVIEAGFPVASQGDFESVQAIAKTVKTSIVCGLSRTSLADIDRCWEAIEPATHKRIHTFIATSDNHMQNKLRMTPDEVKQETRNAVKHARSYTDDVEFSPEDASRSDFEFMCEVLQIAADEGASVLNIPDTVGYGVPEEYAARIAAVREKVKGDYILSTHCHDDLGLAVANSLAGVKAGARQVECAVNGIGERAGNASLEEIVMAIKTRDDYFNGIIVEVDTSEIFKASKLVSKLTGYPVQYNKAVVGRNAFAHESGIHQHGVLNERTTYEIMSPEEVGQSGTSIVLGKHSGRHAFADRIEKIGYKMNQDEINSAFVKFKNLADRKQEFTDSDIEAIVLDEIGLKPKNKFVLDFLKCEGGNVSAGVPKAVVTVSKNGEQSSYRHQGGDGMVDAAYIALQNATNVKGSLLDYSVSSVTGGTDALACVNLVFKSDDGKECSGRGLATDVVEASVIAMLDAVNNILADTRDGDTEAEYVGV